MSDVVTNHARRVYSVIQSGSPAETGGIAGRIALSWKRCVNDYGLDPGDMREPARVSAAELSERQTALADLLMLARPEMASLSQQIGGSGYAIVLTDGDGVVLSCLAEPARDGIAANSHFTPGTIWTERAQGTNALGTCLAEGKPVVIHDTEHFLARNVGLTCSAAPIFDHHGALIAVLDASGEPQVTRRNTVVLVSRAAQRIESRLFLHRFGSEFILRFHSRPDFLDSPGEGTIAFSAAGTVLAADRAACLQLGHASPSQLVDRDISDLFHESAQGLADLSSRSDLHQTAIVEARRGGPFFATVQAPAGAGMLSRPPSRPVRRAVLPTEAAVTPLDALDTGDPVVAAAIRRAKRVLNKDIPVLLYGETGSGKEVFAKAMHLSSERAGKPFVALNCASIPETLIESELFGYKAGAFTGAARDGRRGKIFLANGGTLFLDEIGDVSLDIQTKLLRVLQEMTFEPVGTSESRKVDVRIIAATHQPIEELVRRGRFREDLFYRLNVISLVVPALRERRDDILELAMHFLDRACARSGRTIQGFDDDVVDRLLAHDWPGNIRELENVIERAVVMAGGPVISLEDLPAEMKAAGTRPLRPLAAARTASTMRASPPAGENLAGELEEIERARLLDALAAGGGNKTRAARLLGIPRSTFCSKLKRHGIDADS